MRCLPTLLVTFVSAVVAGVLAYFIADAGSAAHHVLNIEGGRGWLVLSCIVISVVAGVIIGAVAATFRRPKLGRALLTAVAIEAILAAVVTAVVFFTADCAPTLHGRPLSLEFEIMLPAGQPVPKEGTDELDVTVGGIIDQYYPTVLVSGATSRDGRVVVPGSVPLTSHSAQREIMVKLGQEEQQTFELKLPGAPTSRDEAWSDWLTPVYESAQTPAPKEREIAVRYRVQPQ